MTQELRVRVNFLAPRLAIKRRFAVWATLALLIAGGLTAQTPAKSAPNIARSDPWAGLRFMIGSWDAKTTGGMAQAQAAGSYAFRLELRDHILARHSATAACDSEDLIDCRHSDLLYLYFDGPGQTLKAIYFDNEGHVIHYDVSTPKAGTVVLLSEGAQPGPQYRLSYELLDGVMTGKFELKMPGQTEFMSYLEWSGKRR